MYVLHSARKLRRGRIRAKEGCGKVLAFSSIFGVVTVCESLEVTLIPRAPRNHCETRTGLGLLRWNPAWATSTNSEGRSEVDHSARST
jgi:hypothetical protein